MRHMYFFDLDHTILDFQRSEREALKEVFNSRKITLNHTDYEKYGQINAKWWGFLEEGALTKERVVLGRFEEFCEFLDVNLDPKKLNEEYLTALASSAHFLPGAVPFLEKLKEKSKRMAIITNGVYRVQRSRFIIAGLERFFEFSLSSEEVGVAKPNPEIFYLALKRAKLKKHEVLYIGDNLRSDYLGAKSAGIDFIWFHPQAGPGEGPTEFARDYVRLWEILEKDF